MSFDVTNADLDISKISSMNLPNDTVKGNLIRADLK